MENAMVESLSKLSTSHLCILLVGYSIGKVATIVINRQKSAHKARLLNLQLENERLKIQLELQKGVDHAKADCSFL